LIKLLNDIKRFFLFQNADRFCPVCQSYVDAFLPLPEQYRGKVLIRNKEYIAYQKAETLNADSYSCPKCGASDRERLYALYMQNYFFKQHKTENVKMVHFAPEMSLKNFLNTFSFLEYRTADLMMSEVDDKADLTDLHIYKDNYFDFYICSHMLEHIPDDLKAMHELYRILKPGGKGIVVVPILEGLDEIYEDPGIIREEGRLLHFWQEDHVRMYNKEGYLKRLKSVGFKVREYSINDFSKEVFTQVGITHKSVLYVVEK